MEKDNWWSPKGPIKTTLHNAEVIIHQSAPEEDTPSDRKYLLKVELIMVSGRKHILTAHGYYEDEFEEFIAYLKDVKGLLACGSRTLINVNAIELIHKVNSNCFVENPDVDRRKKHGNLFTIEEKR